MAVVFVVRVGKGAIQANGAKASGGTTRIQDDNTGKTKEN